MSDGCAGMSHDTPGRMVTYSVGMAIAAPASEKPHGVSLIFEWRRVRFTLLAAVAFGLLHKLTNETAFIIVLARVMIVAMACLTAFGIFEQWPKRLPRWLPRAALQLGGVAAIVAPAALAAYVLTTGGHPNWKHQPKRVTGYVSLTVTGLLFAPWIAVGAMLKQRDAFARDQALKFELERSELERKALDARLRLLQAQVEPHFLFNTLNAIYYEAYMEAPQTALLIERLSDIMRYFIDQSTKEHVHLATEIQFLDNYIALEKMRIKPEPEIRFQCRVDEQRQIPPMLLMTFVENIFKHGIDKISGNNKIYISLYEKDQHLVFQTKNYLNKHADPRQQHGLGLNNLHQRLTILYGTNFEMHTAKDDQYFTAHLKFPIT